MLGYLMYLVFFFLSNGSLSNYNVWCV